MSGWSVIHETLTIERSYPATPSRVFAAFASAEARNSWSDIDGVEPADGDAGAYELDFRVGGRERFGYKTLGTTYRYESRFYDIVPEQRIIYCYELYADGVRIAVSVATIEFAKNGDGTDLVWTEQGAYLDGIDGPTAPTLDNQGTAEMLDSLTRIAEPAGATVTSVCSAGVS